VDQERMRAGDPEPDGEGQVEGAPTDAPTEPTEDEPDPGVPPAP